MIAKNLMLLILIAGIFTNCNISQNVSTNEYSKINKNKLRNNTRIEDGKCYSKCLMPDQYKSHSKEYAVYTGNELEEKVDVEIRQIELSPKGTKWVKKKADRNCLSPDPNDCLVWCLIEVPAETKELKILVDTTQSKNFELQKINFEELNKKGGYTEWLEVLCEPEITKSVIGQIQNSLRENGYYEKENSLKLDTTTKSALTKFQRANNLPVGKLDFETLDKLEVILN